MYKPFYHPNTYALVYNLHTKLIRILFSMRQCNKLLHLKSARYSLCKCQSTWEMEGVSEAPTAVAQWSLLRFLTVERSSELAAGPFLASQSTLLISCIKEIRKCSSIKWLFWNLHTSQWITWPDFKERVCDWV